MSGYTDEPKEEHLVHEFFLLSVIAKGLISFAEIVAGVFVLVIPPAAITAGTLSLLPYLPSPTLQNMVIQEVAKFTGGTAFFIALYLFPRGLIKLGLVWALLKGKLLAYPLSLLALCALILFQIYQMITTVYLLPLIALTVFDLIVMYFIYREWQILKRHRASVSGT